MSHIALKAVGLLVLFPSTLAAAFFTLLGVPYLLDSIKHPNARYAYSDLLLIPVLAFGWFGLVTMWRLYYHFNADRPLNNIKLHWAGLICGCLVVAALLAAMPGQWLPAWPLIGAAYFMARLWAMHAIKPAVRR